MQSSPLVRAVFAVLLVATVAAFFVTQSLKTEVPVVLRFAVERPMFSPNGDGVRDVVVVGFDLSEPAEVSFSIVTDEGEELRRIVDDRRLAGDTRHRFRWNGRDEDGEVVPDGTYRMRVVRRKEGRVLNSFKTVTVDTTPPRVRLVSAEPGVVDPAQRSFRVRVRYRGPSTRLPEFLVYRTDAGRLRLVRRFRGGENRSGVWAGRVGESLLSSPRSRAREGTYAFQVRVRDRAGNEARAPSGRPSPETARAGTGVAVRALTLRGPLGVVDAGGIAQLEVGPTGRGFRFVLSRLGSTRPLESGRGRGGTLRVRIPSAARTGVFIVRLRSRGRRAVWPLAVAGLPVRRSALDRQRPLVVLPAVTWQGLNPFDSDLDGFGDTLENARSIPLQRPFADRALPFRFGAEVSPLLRFLDRERLPYDLTTDVALARGEGPALGNTPGVAVAGTAEWLPRQVRDRLRSEVEEGGLRLVSFGRKSLRRTVALVDDRLQDPSPPRPDDLFGERTETFRAELPAPLRTGVDRLGLFEGVDELFGEFARFERSVALPEDAELLASAGRVPGRSTLVAYRLGKGVVIRPGTPQWARELRESRLSLEVPRVTKRIWSLLSRPRRGGGSP